MSASTSITRQCHEIDNPIGGLCRHIDNPFENFWPIISPSRQALNEAARWNKNLEKRQFQGIYKEKPPKPYTANSNVQNISSSSG